jgi:hypothetical protein
VTSLRITVEMACHRLAKGGWWWWWWRGGGEGDEEAEAREGAEGKEMKRWRQKVKVSTNPRIEPNTSAHPDV